MTTPDTDTLATYGGAIVNYAAVEDATTDRDAGAANQAYASAAAMTHTSPKIWVRFQAAASSGAMALVANDSHWWGSAAPVLARTGTGVFTITVPATVTDELGVVHTVLLHSGVCGPEGATPFFTTVGCSSNVATVRIFTAAGAATDAVGSVFFVQIS